MLKAGASSRFSGLWANSSQGHLHIHSPMSLTTCLCILPEPSLQDLPLPMLTATCTSHNTFSGDVEQLGAWLAGHSQISQQSKGTLGVSSTEPSQKPRAKAPSSYSMLRLAIWWMQNTPVYITFKITWKRSVQLQELLLGVIRILYKKNIIHVYISANTYFLKSIFIQMKCSLEEANMLHSLEQESPLAFWGYGR